MVVRVAMEQFHNVEVKVRVADLVPVDSALENHYKKHWRNDIETLGQQDFYYDARSEVVAEKLREWGIPDIDDLIQESRGSREGLRIKIREQWNVNNNSDENHTVHLITYLRPDASVRTSSARKREIRVSQKRQLSRLMDALGGCTRIVVKHRRVAWIDGTRVHLDDVQNLGLFVELEAILAADETEESGKVNKYHNVIFVE